jgi:hypothetical protein
MCAPLRARSLTLNPQSTLRASRRKKPSRWTSPWSASLAKPSLALTPCFHPSPSQLTLNDLVRRRFTDPETGRIKLWQELVAGGAAGAGQVVRRPRTAGSDLHTPADRLTELRLKRRSSQTRSRSPRSDCRCRASSPRMASRSPAASSRSSAHSVSSASTRAPARASSATHPSRSSTLPRTPISRKTSLARARTASSCRTSRRCLRPAWAACRPPTLRRRPTSSRHGFRPRRAPDRPTLVAPFACDPALLRQLTFAPCLPVQRHV